MVLRGVVLPKVQTRISQQMRSGNYQLEDGDRSISLFISNSVVNYNNQLDQRERLVVTPLLFTDTTSLSATVLPPTSVAATDFGFGYFSQSTACIATRFGECSSTSLDKLW